MRFLLRKPLLFIQKLLVQVILVQVIFVPSSLLFSKSVPPLFNSAFSIKKMSEKPASKKLPHVCFSKNYITHNTKKVSLQKEKVSMRTEVQWLGGLIAPNYFPAFVTERSDYKSKDVPSFRFLSPKELSSFLESYPNKYICFNYIQDKENNRNYLANVIEKKSLKKTLQTVDGIFDIITQFSLTSQKKVGFEYSKASPNIPNISPLNKDINRQFSPKNNQDIIPDLSNFSAKTKTEVSLQPTIKPFKPSITLKDQPKTVGVQKDSPTGGTSDTLFSKSLGLGSSSSFLKEAQKSPQSVILSVFKKPTKHKGYFNDFKILSTPSEIENYIKVLLGNSAKYIIPHYNKTVNKSSLIDAQLKKAYVVNTNIGLIKNLFFFKKRTSIKILAGDSFSHFIDNITQVKKKRPLSATEKFNIQLLSYIQNISVNNEYSLIEKPHQDFGISFPDDSYLWSFYRSFAQDKTKIFQDLSHQNLYLRYDLSSYFFHGYNIGQFIIIDETGKNTVVYSILNNWTPEK